MDHLLAKLPNRTRKAVITVIGSIVFVAGIIMIPYPGPGWLIVFMGLAILAREYPWASRVLEYARKKYDAWSGWIKRQNKFVQLIAFVATCAIVIFTIWLLNGYGLLNSWFNLGQDWLNSPFVDG